MATSARPIQCRWSILYCTKTKKNDQKVLNFLFDFRSDILHRTICGGNPSSLLVVDVSCVAETTGMRRLQALKLFFYCIVTAVTSVAVHAIQLQSPLAEDTDTTTSTSDTATNTPTCTSAACSAMYESIFKADIQNTFFSVLNVTQSCVSIYFSYHLY
jgi:hypothetical protein